MKREGNGRNRRSAIADRQFEPNHQSAIIISDVMNSLFEDDDPPVKMARAPLAERMRPRTFDEFVGQQDLLAPGKPLREAIERDLLQSIVLWGPPGTGK